MVAIRPNRGKNATVYKMNGVKHKCRTATKVPILVFLSFLTTLDVTEFSKHK